MTCTVIIITLERPDYVRRCLTRLAAQQPVPDQVIVVDTSRDTRTQQVVSDFPGVLYLRNDSGFGRMTTSRNIALRHAVGNIIAFLDDDAFAHDGWLVNLLACYEDPTVGAAGGRALNGQPDEDRIGVHEIGRLKPNGVLSGNFAADPGKIIEVDHVMGCNMSFRRQALAQLGGFREDYPGISGLREDTDMSLRVRRLGWRVVFNPRAAVDHIGAPQAIGRRFDVRYAFFDAQNHWIMLIQNDGLWSRRPWRYLARSTAAALAACARRIGGAVARLAAISCGTVLGMVRGTVFRLRCGADPVRRDAAARQITEALTACNGSPAPRSDFASSGGTADERSGMGDAA